MSLKMSYVVITLGTLASCIIGRLALLSSRAGHSILNPDEHSILKAILVILSGMTSIGIFILGFSLFSWWVWLVYVFAMQVVANLIITQKNFWIFLPTMTLLNIAPIGAFLWLLVMLP
jgi:hypothetical protein